MCVARGLYKSSLSPGDFCLGIKAFSTLTEMYGTAADPSTAGTLPDRWPPFCKTNPNTGLKDL
jgi:hypothetical protein